MRFVMRIATLFALAFALAMSGCAQRPASSDPAPTPQASFQADPVDPLQLSTVSQPEPYAYLQLDADDQERYRILLDMFQTREARDYPDDDMDRLVRIRTCVLSDHPELFYVGSVSMERTGNVLTGEITHVSIEGHYTYSPEEVAAIVARADLAAEECFATVEAGTGDYEKSKHVYDYLAEHVRYDHAAAGVRGVIGDDAESTGEPEPHPDQNIDGALVRGSAVCGGYASACQYLLQRAGVQCTYISGAADGESHAWCLALLDGSYYFIDPTWGDLQYYDAASESAIEAGSVSYDYLNVTTADIEKTHAIGSPFPVAACTASADNYYVREGLLFDWADEARLGALAAADFDAGRTTQIRCADEGTFVALYDGFVSTGQLGRYLPVSRYRYSCSPELLTISVFPA